MCNLDETIVNFSALGLAPNATVIMARYLVF